MEHIDGALYINLEKRLDRRAQFEEECDRMEISVERFPALEANPGFVGCHKSHLAALKLAKARGYKNVLIFEDDFQFIVTKEVFESQLRAFFALDIPYDVLMLSYNLQKAETYNDIIGRAREVQTASGYIVHNRFYDTLIKNLEDHLEPLLITKAHWLHLNDQCWKEVQPAAEWFYLQTRIGVQRPSYSDLACRFVDYGGV
jgi:GR25 family glycosyltransferase involved in LPS biosynthesis